MSCSHVGLNLREEKIKNGLRERDGYNSNSNAASFFVRDDVMCQIVDGSRLQSSSSSMHSIVLHAQRSIFGGAPIFAVFVSSFNRVESSQVTDRQP